MMPPSMIAPYPAPIEAQMQRYYQSLSEKDRRGDAAVEAVKLGYGGQALFGGYSAAITKP